RQTGAKDHSAASDAPQECNTSNGQPLSHEDVATLKENSRVRGDELSRGKLAARLIAARAYLSVRRFAVAQLSYDVVIPVEDANLAVEIRANHPIALGVKVAGHSQMGFVLDCADVCAGQREGLNAAVSAVSDEQRWFFRAKIDPQTVRRVEFAVAVA